MNTALFSTRHVTATPSSSPGSDQDHSGHRALVLGGGGATGNAWSIGVIAGLFEAGLADATTHAIDISCRTKAEIVAADERETKDIRALLNLGHTFGHALETLGGYDGRLLHGEAVAIGLLLAHEFSAQSGICPAADVARLCNRICSRQG